MQEAFGGISSNFNIIYDNKNLPRDGNKRTLGETEVFLKTNGRIQGIIIWLDNELLNKGTDVSIFSTVVHENMHALMFYQLDNMNIAPDNPNVDFSIMADLWSKAVAERSGQQLGSSQLPYVQHEIMSNLVNTMSGTILDLAKGEGYTINSTQATALAWSGLFDSVAWTVMDGYGRLWTVMDGYGRLWTVMDGDLKDTYENIIENEATGFEVLSVGTRCN